MRVLPDGRLAARGGAGAWQSRPAPGTAQGAGRIMRCAPSRRKPWRAYQAASAAAPHAPLPAQVAGMAGDGVLAAVAADRRPVLEQGVEPAEGVGAGIQRPQPVGLGRKHQAPLAVVQGGSHPARSAKITAGAARTGCPSRVNVSARHGLNVTRGRPAVPGRVLIAVTVPIA